MGPFLLSFACALTIAIQSEADDAYTYICGLADKGMSELVVREATAFVRDHPEHGKVRHARYRLAAALFELGRRQDAQPVFEELARDRSFEFVGEANLRLGQCALAAGDAPKATTAFTRAIEWGREYLADSARALRAEARFATKDWKGAREDWERVLAKPTVAESRIDAQIGIAWCAYRAGDAADAIKRVDDLFAAQAVPTARAGELQCLRGEACLDVGRVQDALTSFRSVRGLSPADVSLADTASRGTGYALAALGDHRNAAIEFARVALEHVNSRYAAECALQCGVERLAAGDAVGAREILSKAIVGDSVTALFWRARAEMDAGDSKAALATLDRADRQAAAQSAGQLAGDEWKQRLSIARGTALERLGRKDDAARAFEASGSLAALQSAAALDLANGRADEAAALAQKILDKNPTAERAALAWFVMGEARFASQRWKEGETAFAHGAEIDPDAQRAARARLRAAWCRYSSGDARGACELFEAAISPKLETTDAEEASFMRARAADAAGARDEAARFYRAHLAKFENGAHAVEANVRLARSCDDASAVAILDAVLRGHADDVRSDEARFDLAERLSSMKNWKEATRRYAEIVMRAPHSALASRAHYGLAWCAFELGDQVTAAREVAALERDEQVDPELRAAAFELAAWVAIQAKDDAAALRAWRNVVSAARSDTQEATVARISLSKSLVERLRTANKIEEASKVVDDLARTSNEPAVAAQVAVLRARLNLDRKRLDDATAELVRARAANDPASQTAIAEVAFAVGEARFDAQEDALAIEAYAIASAVKHAPCAELALYKSGFSKLRTKDWPGAEHDFARLVDEHPKSTLFHEALFLRGEALYRSDKLDEALACFERVRKEAPRHAVLPKVLYRAGLAYARRERWSEASEALASLARTKPDFENIDEAELWRGRALTALGDVRGARSAFERVIQHDKGSFADQSRIEIGRAALVAGDLDGALAAFLKVAVLSSDDDAVSEALWNAGDVLEQLGQGERSLQQYREIVEKHAASRFAVRAREKLGPARAPPSNTTGSTGKRRA